MPGEPTSMPNTKILYLGRYTSQAASTRYRALQYVPYLEENGFNVTAKPLLDSEYLQRRYSGQNLNYLRIAQRYLHRAWDWHSAGKYDLIWLQYEALPLFPAWLESALRSNIPFVVDYDDAVFHNYDKHSNGLIKHLLSDKIDSVMSNASLVVAGNPYIADRASRAGARSTAILPTVIDLNRYPVLPPVTNDIFTIGWIGTPMTEKYLKSLEPVFQNLSRITPIRVLAIGAANLKLDGVPLEIIPWSEETEFESIRNCDVGIMPLDDTLWERGKCGFKLIQYMASGIPIVGTPIGVNSEIIIDGANGYQAMTHDEWINSILSLKHDPVLRLKMGQFGRKLVEEKYCLQQTAPRLVELFNELKKNKNVRN